MDAIKTTMFAIILFSGVLFSLYIKKNKKICHPFDNYANLIPSKCRIFQQHKTSEIEYSFRPDWLTEVELTLLTQHTPACFASGFDESVDPVLKGWKARPWWKAISSVAGTHAAVAHFRLFICKAYSARHCQVKGFSSKLLLDSSRAMKRNVRDWFVPSKFGDFGDFGNLASRVEEASK